MSPPRFVDPWPWWVDAVIGILGIFVVWLLVVKGWPFNALS